MQRAQTDVLYLMLGVRMGRSAGVWAQLRGGQSEADSPDAPLPVPAACSEAGLPLLSSAACTEAGLVIDVQLGW